ncbi:MULTISPECIES: tetratricopeptide repeat-containing sensor histidine kinase [Rhodonellum]|nr:MULTISPECIES: tetratricopeptide repeat-containing sensor histidine kinase [Rhodonellum]MDO9553894.1 tetratricopeptide repeat-containing sensor histidine kinase [Rhodonellum sp.]SDZ53304.1 Signal transduction histidine kinase [Rhodonellum ikkaensis]
MFTVFLIFWSLVLQALPQQSLPDSLKNSIVETENDSIKAVLFLDLSKHYYSFEQDSAIYFANQSIIYSEKLGLKKHHASALNVIGVSNLIKSEYESALKAHFGALTIRENIDDSVGMLESNLNLGNIYYRSGEIEKAEKMYQKALVFGLKTNNQRGLALIYNNLGSYHRDKWRGNSKGEDFDLAMDYLQKALEIKESMKDDRGMINSINQLSELYLESGDSKTGIKMLNRALELIENQNDVESKISVLCQISDFHRADKNYKKAMDYAEQAFAIAQSIKSRFQITHTAGRISTIALAQNDFKKAYEYLVIQKTNDDAFFSENRQKVREELTIQYESEKKELENQGLIQEQEFSRLSLQRKNELLIIIIIAVLLMAVLLLGQIKNYKKLKFAHHKLRKSLELVKKQHLQIQSQTEHLNETNLALSKANIFRDKLFSIISHDLRGPFSNIHSTIELWNFEMLSHQELEEMMKLISRDTNAASLMLENLLVWARTQMGSNVVQMKEFNLNKLIETNIEFFNVQLARKNQELVNKIPIDQRVISDKDRLNFIIRNIVMNAIKFTPVGGKIYIEILDRNDGEIIIRDTGMGMNESKVAKIFGNKNQSTKGTDGETGTGIGLMLCKDFADSINAELEVESTVNLGTSFIIKLNNANIPIDQIS